MLITDEQVKLRLQRRSVSGFVFLAASGLVIGSRIVPSAEVDRAFGMPIGKLRSRAGIESLAYASDDETEVTLGRPRRQRRPSPATCPVSERIDSIVATSETYHLIHRLPRASLRARRS